MNIVSFADFRTNIEGVNYFCFIRFALPIALDVLYGFLDMELKGGPYIGKAIRGTSVIGFYVLCHFSFCVSVMFYLIPRKLVNNGQILKFKVSNRLSWIA